MSTAPDTGQLVSVIAPFGGAWSVPTSPTIVPLVHVTAALASTAKPVDAVDCTLLSLRWSRGAETPGAASLHAAASTARLTTTLAAILAGARVRAGRTDDVCLNMSEPRFRAGKFLHLEGTVRAAQAVSLRRVEEELVPPRPHRRVRRNSNFLSTIPRCGLSVV